MILGWSFYSLWPSIKYQSLSNEDKESLREQGKLSIIESRVIRQGLDLKGGMFIALEADIPALVKSLASNRNEKFNNLFEILDLSTPNTRKKYLLKTKCLNFFSLQATAVDRCETVQQFG